MWKLAGSASSCMRHRDSNVIACCLCLVVHEAPGFM
ncbi:hypothetical protein T10_1560 [Trichinella papuae]|uniref:Uncharacterized protein n=1 Tax=Trichinella papuae TaxID=268474 RepID=A0A0V1LVI8_9BILA|nr:hypothetical protein T10_1560 [Trichinella papuae]